MLVFLGGVGLCWALDLVMDLGLAVDLRLDLACVRLGCRTLALDLVFDVVLVWGLIVVNFDDVDAVLNLAELGLDV